MAKRLSLHKAFSVGGLRELRKWGSQDSDAFDQMESLRDRTMRLISMYADRISLAGLQDVRMAPQGLWKVFWTLSLLSCHISFIYLAGVTFAQHLTDSNRKKMQREVIEVKVDVLPFPNVTICGPSQIDLNEIRDRLVIPPDVERKALRKFKSRDKLIEAFLVYIAYSTNEKPQVEVEDYLYMEKIARASAKYFPSFNAAIIRYIFNCTQVVLSCSFDGQPFDCCDGAVTVFADDKLCFTFRTDKKVQEPGVEIRQSSGFEVDMCADWRFVPPTYTDMTDGWMVQVGSVYTTLADAVGVPNGMELIVRLTPYKNTQAFKCFKHQTQLPPLKYYSYYDPDGYNCHAEQFLDSISAGFVNCLIPYDSFLPNDSQLCDSKQGQILHDLIYGKYDQYGEELMENGLMTKKDHWLNARSHLRNIFYNGKCQPMCTTQEYSMHIGYSELSPSPTTVHPHYSRSRIKVFFTDTKYMESTESPAFNVYLLFYKLGYLASVYAGLSVVGFIELLAYGLVIARYWIMYKVKDRREKQEKKQSASTGKKGNGNWSTPYRTDMVKSVRIIQHQTTL